MLVFLVMDNILKMMEMKYGKCKPIKNILGYLKSRTATVYLKLNDTFYVRLMMYKDEHKLMKSKQPVNHSKILRFILVNYILDLLYLIEDHHQNDIFVFWET